jgi:hypothetical protein
MRYLLLIYAAEATEPVAPEIMQAEMEGYNAFTEEVQRRGVMLGGDALEPTSTATTVRVQDGRTTATDGPFAETKEALGGFYLVDARDLDEAIELAAMIPAAKHGAIEIRPIWEMPSDATTTSTAAIGSR